MPILTFEERVGTRIAGKYRLERILGRGGFGAVFEAVHEWTDRRVAVKILSHELGRQDAFVRRFLQEARAAARLGHPSVVDVLDMGQDGDAVYLVLELLRGRDLNARLAEEAPLSLGETARVLVPIMDALAEAHEAGIVHRDLKPDNVFLSDDGRGRTVPKLLDFGIAKLTDGSGGMTQTGMVIGTPHYMSPEQARGLADIGPEADVWSMGVLLWRCLSASVPYDAGTPTGVIAEVLTKTAPSFAVAAPWADAVAPVVDRALARDRAARFADMGAMKEAFVAALEGAPAESSERGPSPPVAAGSTPVTELLPTPPPGAPPPEPVGPAHPTTPWPRSPGSAHPTRSPSTAPAPQPSAHPTTPLPQPVGAEPTSGEPAFVGSQPTVARRGSPLAVVAAIVGLGALALVVGGTVALWPATEATDASEAAELDGPPAEPPASSVVEPAHPGAPPDARPPSAPAAEAMASTASQPVEPPADDEESAPREEEASGGSGHVERGVGEADVARSGASAGSSGEVAGRSGARRGRSSGSSRARPRVRPLGGATPPREPEVRLGTRGAPILGID